MKRLFGLGAATLFLIGIAAVSMSQGPSSSPPPPGDLRIEVEKKNPWTHLRMNNDPREFRFAIVSDRTGGHRARIFARAVERLNLLQPEFVVSVGDLIEGYTEEPEKMTAQWKEFDRFVNQLQMPFFYVAGNHDISNPKMIKHWEETYGRKHYHFVYRKVLFLLLNSEDPNVKDGDLITAEQQAYVKQTLEANRDVRWTFVFLHKPLWIMANPEKSGWLDVEKLLDGRVYSVFAGHVHRYGKFVRQGQNYYMLATTGGASKLRGVSHGEFDHLTWVTMKKDGPVVANLMLDGIYPDTMQVSDPEEPGVSTRNNKAVYPAQAKVTFEGKPISGAMVALYTYAPTTKKYAKASDGYTDADGICRFSTYTAFDGAPAGEYTVTVTWQSPRFDVTGRPTPNRLPARFATADKSPLKAAVVAGAKNEFAFPLQP